MCRPYIRIWGIQNFLSNTKKFDVEMKEDISTTLVEKPSKVDQIVVTLHSDDIVFVS